MDTVKVGDVVRLAGIDGPNMLVERVLSVESARELAAAIGGDMEWPVLVVCGSTG